MTVINRWLATGMLQYHPLITRSKASLDSSGFLAQGFWSWFYKLALFDTVISGQNITIPSTRTTKQALDFLWFEHHIHECLCRCSLQIRTWTHTKTRILNMLARVLHRAKNGRRGLWLHRVIFVTESSYRFCTWACLCFRRIQCIAYPPPSFL